MEVGERKLSLWLSSALVFSASDQPLEQLVPWGYRRGYSQQLQESFGEEKKASDGLLQRLMSTFSTSSLAARDCWKWHMLTLPAHDNHLSDCNFLTRILFKHLLVLSSYYDCVHKLAFCQVFIKRTWYVWYGDVWRSGWLCQLQLHPVCTRYVGSY